jgi:hypothetical protein
VLQQAHAVVAPKRLLLEVKHRHAEHLVGHRLFLGALVIRWTLAGEIVPIALRGKSETLDHRGDRVGLVRRQLALEEQVEDLVAVVADLSMFLGIEPADQHRRGVEYLERAADHESAAHIRPAPRVHVGVFHFVFGILAALALAFEPQLERLPLQLDLVLVFERECRIESQEGIRTLEVRIHFHFFAILLHA